MKYFLNTLYYSFWRAYVAFFSSGTKITYSIFKFLFAPLVPRRFKSRISDRVNRNMKNTLEDLLNYKTGTIIILFNQLFMGLCSAYLTGVAVIIFSIMFKISNSFLISIAISLMCFVVGLYPVYQYVLDDKRYIKYFKEFERKDEAWHRKWRRIAVILIVLQLPVMAIGALLAFMIVFAGLD